ncbi:hypothetical protein K458DRAFT_392682 [Lentithecium fluviatile CBS 122367]|uniref:Uncharacterized protein n=1 Tax=Lentithecium fluviatile CBS 122367 TaxID=1168545 RepID=A0A6G1IQW4_9PLEO|nr:hypothetical protein K458DRAFT_392682 [Lentithecium fluviatile CBS 122367]
MKNSRNNERHVLGHGLSVPAKIAKRKSERFTCPTCNKSLVDTGPRLRSAHQSRCRGIPTAPGSSICSTNTPEDSGHPSTNRDIALDSFISWYKQNAMQAVANARRHIEATIQEHGAGTRVGEEYPIYLEDILGRCHQVQPISAAHYETIRHGNGTFHPCTIVICSATQARILLDRHGALRVSLMVLVEMDDSPAAWTPMSMESYLSYLHGMCQDLDVHGFSKPANRYPERRGVAEIIRNLNDPGGPIINCLNLTSRRPNKVPWILENNYGFHLLERVKENGKAGKDERANPSDLSSGLSFMLLGKRRVFSLPHVDRHGLYTIVYCETGSKL